MSKNNHFRHKVFIAFILAAHFGSVLLYPVKSYAAVPLLERVITIVVENERIDVALNKISQQGNFTFSYNPAAIDAGKIVTAAFTGMTVREVLDELFKGTVHYKARGNYIILTKGQVTSTSNSRTYSGYVVDESTGERLKNVSVYDPVSLSSAVTDSYGYFQIKIDKPTTDLKLAVNKRNYADTIVTVFSGKNNLLKIPISIDKQKIETLADSVAEKIKRFWEKKVLALSTTNVDNIRDTIYRTTQVSLIPYVGTNHRLSGNVINDYSFNIFGGYSRGVRELELGGLFNVDREDVDGFQFAGVFNAVGGKSSGGQVAGVANLNLDTVKAVQFAGLINLNGSSTQKFSAAGLLNVTKGKSQAVQLAGQTNYTMGDQESPHIAGLFNFTTEDVRPTQVSGLMNFAGGNLRGVQVAGLLNFTGKDVHGAQVSGLFNYAANVRGAQVGLLNIADSVKGIQLGVFSFTRNGYHKIEISADEIFYTNLAFRTGVPHFYNIFTAGVKPGSFDEDDVYWTFGYGVGSAPRLTRWLSLNVDLTANQIVQGNNFEAINLLNKLFLGVEFEPLKKVGLAIGITLNGHLTDPTYQYPDLFTDYKPEIRHEEMYGEDLSLKLWWGGKIGLRFL